MFGRMKKYLKNDMSIGSGLRRLTTRNKRTQRHLAHSKDREGQRAESDEQKDAKTDRGNK
jgi:hypothetical protein